VIDFENALGSLYIRHLCNSMLAGHSVGAWWHQQEPVISRDNPRRLEEGMVIAMEPHINNWHIQDMLLIGRMGRS
jgi:Xaa-Pro aminopeptidase